MIENIKLNFYKLISTFIGIILSATVIGVLHVVQGMIINDWSGLHSYFRFYYIINYVVLGIGMSGGILIVIHFSKTKMIINLPDFFKYGLVLGSVGFSNLLHPWLYFEYIDLVFFLAIFLISFFKAKI